VVTARAQVIELLRLNNIITALRKDSVMTVSKYPSKITRQLQMLMKVIIHIAMKCRRRKAKFAFAKAIL
jgi:hypothetical protein